MQVHIAMERATTIVITVPSLLFVHRAGRETCRLKCRYPVAGGLR